MWRLWTSACLVAVLASSPLPAVDFSWLFLIQTELAERPLAAPGERAVLPWKAEFDRICGAVQMAPYLTAAELEALIEDCRKLAAILADSDEPQAKVFLKRIDMCREFFEYSLELSRQPDD